VFDIWCRLHLHLFILLYKHTRLTAFCPGLPRWAGTRKVKPIWILLKQETVGGSGISWAICKSAPRCRQTTTSAPHHSVFYRRDAIPSTQPTASKHWRHILLYKLRDKYTSTSLYCLGTEARVWTNLPKVVTWKQNTWELNPSSQDTSTCNCDCTYHLTCYIHTHI